MNTLSRWVLATACILGCKMAYAYVGPGVGLSVIGSVLALVGAVLLMILGFVWYPVKQLLRRRSRGFPISENQTNAQENLHPDRDGKRK